MHYFQFEIKEWMANTGHLTEQEESYYLRLILYYYDSEQAIPLDPTAVFRKLRIKDFEVGMQILKEFFIEIDIGWDHNRCNQEIHKYQAKIEQASKAGKASAERRFNSRSTAVQPIINQESLIKNHKSIKTIPTPEGVSSSVFEDFVKLRKGLKAPVTETALKGLEREARKADMSLQEVLELCCQNGWRGFKAEWMDKNKSAGQKPDKMRNFWDQINNSDIKALGDES